VIRVTRLVAALAAGLVAASLPTLPSSAADPQQGSGLGIRLADAAVERKDDPRAHIYIDDHLKPGASITRHVVVADLTDKPMPAVHMYAAASTIVDDGWQVAEGATPNELTDWMKITPSTLSLQPGESKVVTVKIDVPNDASKGERYATVIAELPPPASSEGSQVRVASRVGVRVYLNIGSGGEPASDFTISTLTAGRADDGTPTVTASVTNTGGRALDLGGRLQLSDGPGGLRAGPFEVQAPRTLGIGQTGDVVVALDKQTPAGPWLAKMTLRSGYVEHAVRGTILFPDAAGDAGDPVKAVPVTNGNNWLLPVLGLLLLGILGLILFLLWRRRRRKDDDEEPTAGTPTPTLPAQRAVPEPEREPVAAAAPERVRRSPEPITRPVAKPARKTAAAPARKSATSSTRKAAPKPAAERTPEPPVRETAPDAGGDDAISRLRRR
jgi:LPXTG-motif cell wall-anchored protein